MHQLIIVLNNSQTNFLLSFKTKDAAYLSENEIADAMNQAIEGTESNLLITDDYGHRGFVVASSITGVLVSSTVEEMDAHVDKKVIETYAQNKLTRKLQSDPTLKLSMGTLNG